MKAHGIVYASAGPLRGRHEVSRGEKMLYSGTDPESYITEYTLVYEDNQRSVLYNSQALAINFGCFTHRDLSARQRRAPACSQFALQSTIF